MSSNEYTKRKSLEERIAAFRAKGDQYKERMRKRKAASRPDRERSSKPWTIYFIQVGNDGPIKIGRTVRSPLHRMDSLQVGIPTQLRLLAIISHCPARMEGELHRRFSHLSDRGEWFKPGPDLLDYIRENALPWNLTRADVPGWWWTPFDLRNKEMVEDSLKHPKMFRNDPMGGFPDYEAYLRWRSGGSVSAPE